MDGEDLVINNIKSRRSIRSFKDAPIPKDLVEKIVEAGKFAPSALNRQPWRFVAIADKDLIKELSGIATARLKRIYSIIPILRLFSKDLKDPRVINAIRKTATSLGDTVFHNAPLLIFVANDTRFEDTDKDCYLAAQNMMLAAHSLGIGSCFIGRAKVIPQRFLLKRFNLPPFYHIDVHIAFGYPKESPKTQAPRRDIPIIWVK